MRWAAASSITIDRWSGRSCAMSAASDYRFSELVLGIVNSMPFQMRKAEAQQTSTAAAAH